MQCRQWESWGLTHWRLTSFAWYRSIWQLSQSMPMRCGRTNSLTRNQIRPQRRRSLKRIVSDGSCQHHGETQSAEQGVMQSRRYGLRCCIVLDCIKPCLMPCLEHEGITSCQHNSRISAKAGILMTGQ